MTVFFQTGILSNFSVFWLNDVAAVSCMYFSGTINYNYKSLYYILCITLQSIFHKPLQL